MKIVFLFLLCSITVYAQTDSVYLWPKNVPGESKPKSAPVPNTLDDGSIRVVEVTNPFIAVFTPAEYNRNGKAVMICPGGGYARLAVHKEGYAVAQWLSGLGYTAFVLHYRVPDKRDGALQDMERAMKLVRSNAKKYRINPNKIGAIGFSAGAHVVARAGMIEKELVYPKQDNADTVSFRPNVMMIIYPGYLDAGPDRSLTPELKVSDKTVDTFIFQAMDDGIVQSSFALAQALRTAKANVELHLVSVGGHGFGMYPGNKAAEAWPGLLEVWLKDHL